MKKNTAQKIEIAVVVVFFVCCVIFSLRYLAGVSADIENGAAVSPVKITDFTRLNAYDKSSFIVFSNISSDDVLNDANGLNILNIADKYSTILAEPVILQKDKDYKTTIEFSSTYHDEDFSINYGVVEGDLIGKPIYSAPLDLDQGRAVLQFKIERASPMMFQYLRVLGEGKVTLQSIMLEEIITAPPEKTENSGNIDQAADITPQETPEAKTAENTLSVPTGYTPYGTSESLDSEIFTKLNLSVYLMQEDGWKIAKPREKDSNFTIPARQGVYLQNETGVEVNVTLEKSSQALSPQIGKSWNVLFSTRGQKLDDFALEYDAFSSLAQGIDQGKISKYGYLIDPSSPSDMTKIDFSKIRDLPENHLVWIYVF